jgi:hypothetical protein
LTEEQVKAILKYLSSKDKTLKLEAKSLGKKADMKRSKSAKTLKDDEEFMALLPVTARSDTVLAWIDRMYKFYKQTAGGGKKSEYAALARELGVLDKGSTKDMIERILTTSMYVFKPWSYS